MPINKTTSAAVFTWRPAAWLQVTGDDAATFLQGQFTNDLRGIEVGEARYGLWLSIKGKVLADSFVIRGAGAGQFWVGSYFSAASVIRERLEGYVIADDVTLADETDAWAGVSVLAGEGQAVAGWDAGLTQEGVVFRGRRGGAGLEVLYRVGDGLPAMLSQRMSAVPELTESELERRRIAAGIPAVPADVGPGDLPNEARLEAEAISYTKGCYLGQEVMARLKSMGQVRRRLVRVRGAGECPESLPAALFAGERRAGEVRSAVSDEGGGWIGMAMISLLAANGASELALAAPASQKVGLVDPL
ncbi:MAG: folate-binding protein [Opitutaceae bacterium]|nr:folate-binding protein [Opitutaceae bacterium]